MNNQPELTIHIFDIKAWRLNGELHREDGPALEYPNGYKAWFINGKRHRINGPAIDGGPAKKKIFFLNNIEYSKEEWFKRLTPEQQYNYLWNLDE
jgi:hypothetical protein